MKIVNFPNGFRPREGDFLKREENKAAEFERLREAFGRGIVSGLQLTRQSDGGVTLSNGHGHDGAGQLILATQSATLDLQGIALPQIGKFRYVAVILNYQQVEQGQAEAQWAERVDSYTVDYLLGAEADSEAAAQRPAHNGAGLRVGDILFDDNGTRSVDTLAAEYLSAANQALGVDLDFAAVLGFDSYNGSQKLSQYLAKIPEMTASSSAYWVDGINYQRGDVKIYRATQYLCTTEHTATAANAPGGAGRPWDTLANESSISGAIQDAKTAADETAASYAADATHSLTAAITAAKQQALEAAWDAQAQAREDAWPIGSIYTSAVLSGNPQEAVRSGNPSQFDLLGFGTWAAVSITNGVSMWRRVR